MLVDFLRAITPLQLAAVLSSLSPEDLANVRRSLRIKRTLDGSEESAAVLRSMVLMGVRKGWPGQFAESATAGPHATAMTVLGEDFDNPTEEETRRAIVAVLNEHGATLTCLWLAFLLSCEVRATPHIVKICSETPELDALINAEAPAESSATNFELLERERKDRSEQRASARELRRRKNESDNRSRANNKRFKRSRIAEPTSVENTTPTPSTDAPTDAPTPTKLTFPHLGRWPKADPHHELVGSVVNAYVSFTSNWAEGKVRPVVVLAVEPKRVIVKPLYSRPRHGAGLWRAIEIIDWQSAGLLRKSWAGDEVHCVKKTSEPHGRLSLADWNRVCRGEVNRE